MEIIIYAEFHECLELQLGTPLTENFDKILKMSKM